MKTNVNYKTRDINASPFGKKKMIDASVVSRSSVRGWVSDRYTVNGLNGDLIKDISGKTPFMYMDLVTTSGSQLNADGSIKLAGAATTGATGGASARVQIQYQNQENFSFGNGFGFCFVFDIDTSMSALASGITRRVLTIGQQLTNVTAVGNASCNEIFITGTSTTPTLTIRSKIRVGGTNAAIVIPLADVLPYIGNKTVFTVWNDWQNLSFYVWINTESKGSAAISLSGGTSTMTYFNAIVVGNNTTMSTTAPNGVNGDFDDLYIVDNQTNLLKLRDYLIKFYAI